MKKLSITATITPEGQCQEDCRTKVCYIKFTNSYNLTVKNKLTKTEKYYVLYPDGYVNVITVLAGAIIKTNHKAPAFQQGIIYVVPLNRLTCPCPDIPIGIYISSPNP